jgi:hypothetical protein
LAAAVFAFSSTMADTTAAADTVVANLIAVCAAWKDNGQSTVHLDGAAAVAVAVAVDNVVAAAADALLLDLASFLLLLLALCSSLQDKRIKHVIAVAATAAATAAAIFVFAPYRGPSSSSISTSGCACALDHKLWFLLKEGAGKVHDGDFVVWSAPLSLIATVAVFLYYYYVSRK